MIVRRVEFAGAVGAMNQEPPGTLPQVAFAGRSNVGKSSLINRLLGRPRKRIARVSGVPGKTRELNFYRVNDAFFLVDLPGIGYARAPAAAREAWSRLVRAYLSESEALRGVAYLVDSRHPPMDADREFVGWLADRGVPALVVLTKVDKLKARERERGLAKRACGALGVDEEQIVATSARTGEGKEEVLAAVAALLDEADATPPADEATQAPGRSDAASQDDAGAVLSAARATRAPGTGPAALLDEVRATPPGAKSTQAPGRNDAALLDEVRAAPPADEARTAGRKQTADAGQPTGNVAAPPASACRPRPTGLGAGLLAAGWLAACAPAAAPGTVTPATAPEQGAIEPFSTEPQPRSRAGSLRQDQISVRVSAGPLSIEVTPLDDWTLDAAAPDTKARLGRIRDARRNDALRRSAASSPALFLVSFSTIRDGMQFQPEDLHVIANGLRERPLAILPVTPGWGSHRLRQQSNAMALYVYEAIDLKREFAVAYQQFEDASWAAKIPLIEAERARLQGREENIRPTAPWPRAEPRT